jgi:PAS domain S-box-containing protein
MVRKKSLSGEKNATAGAPESVKDTDDLAASVDKPSPDRPCFVVGIGASAGGQAALEQIFTAMPPDCGLTFVVIMHIPPDGPSLLADLLGRYTSMDVVTAEDGMALAPSRIQVIPPGRDLVVSGDRLRLVDPAGTSPLHHPIDRFFHSLAAELKERAIAVVLSGFGTDGAEGVKGVREAGGIVMVQEPASALNPAMPRSAIATGTAEFILSPEDIPVKIAEIARGTCTLAPRACRTVTLEEELHAVFSIVKAKTGHDFSSYKTNTVLRRIERRMAVNEVGGIGKYVALLEENAQEAQALCQDILIGVTSFFRDPEAFEVLKREIIPRLFAGRDSDDLVRIWHACCATGEEVYSTAILIREYLDQQRITAKVQFFATDIDEEAIAQARAGLYPDDIAAELGEERLKAFFTRTNNRWQVAKHLREMVVFAHHSLIKDPPFSRLDLLVCRNFLIYLNPDMQKRLVPLFHMVLKPRGFLFLGASETVGRHSDLFTPINKKWKIFERLEGDRREETLFPFTAPIRRLPRSGPPPQRLEAGAPSPGAIAEKLLMERYSPPCVVVNEKYEVIHVSTRTSRFLEVPVGEPTRDILKMAGEELRPALRAAIYKAFAEQREVVFRGVKVADGKEEAAVNVLVEPLKTISSAERLVMVILEPAAPPSAPAAVGADEERPGDEASRAMLIRQLEEQLRINHEQLQATSEQLETSNEGFMSANEELMSINEEFQSTNEELQSTNEELETSKEELQALNEELVTVNAELQGKVEELNQANSDMENLLASSEIATIFLDRRLIIKGFTPAMATIFNLIPADIGRPFRHLASTIDWSGIPADAQEVLEKLSPIEREVTAVEGGLSYLMRVLPYRIAEGKIDGIVVTLIDITEHKRMEEQTLHLASFPQLNPNPVLEVNSSGRIIFSNPATRKILESFGMDATAVEVFLPPDLDCILQDWDRKSEATLHREINVRDRAFGETIFLTPQFDVARIYAFDITERKRAENVTQARLRVLTAAADLSLDESLQMALDEIEALTGSTIGFYHFLEADQETLSLQAWSSNTLGNMCTAEGKGSHYPVSQAGVWVDCIQERRPVIHNDYAALPHIKGMPAGHAPVVREMLIPIVREDLIVAIIGVGNKPTEYNATDIEIASYLGDFSWEIVERKRAEKALRESEERVRHKLESIISPEGDIGNLDLADIIDAPALQSLVDNFYELTGMPMGLIDLKGKVLVGVGWKEICTKFHRVHLETSRNCVESDVQLSAGIPHGEYKVYKCKNNLWDVATPVMVGDRHFGNLFMGQFFFEDEPLDYELFRSQAGKYGFDEQEYIAALEAVPRLSRQTLDISMHFFMKLADILSKQSYSNLKLARSLTERDALMKSLRENEEQLQLFIEHAPAALAMFDTEMRYLSVSRRWLSDYGLGERDLTGKFHYDVFPEITAEWREIHRRGLAGEVVRADADRFERADGSVQWIRWEVRPWYDAVGNIGGIVIFADDITGIKNAEEVLRRYELLAGNSRDIILFLKSDNGRILEANTAAMNAYGFDHDELLGLTVNELRAPDTVGLTAAQMAEADSHGILFETVHCRRDGSTFPVEVSSQGSTIGGTRTLISVIRDITERKRAEESLRLSEHKFRTLFNSMTESFTLCSVVYDANGKPDDFLILDANPASLAMNGLKHEEFVGKTWKELWPGAEGYWWDICNRVVLHREDVRHENYAQVHDRWYEVHHFSAGKDRLATLSKDITERKRAEEEIRQHVEELTRFNRASVGRELRMIELKKEINELTGLAGQPSRYPLEFEKL